MEVTSFRYLTGQVLEKELQKSTMLIDDFVYSCSHGLRSPVKSMAGLVSLLKQNPEEADRQLYLRLLSQSISKAQTIREQFEEFSNVLKTQQPNELISLNSLFKKLIRKCNTKLTAAGISVDSHIDQKEAFHSNAKGVYLILSLLLSNAITFNKPERPEKHISLFATCSAYSCSIQIHDNGEGIDDFIQNKVFNLFYRGSEQSKGAGIGLYIAREVAIKLGGTLSLQSSGHTGSVFSLWLPNHAVKSILSGNL